MPANVGSRSPSPPAMHEALKAHAVLAGQPSGCGLATVVAVEGSSYRRPGARLVLTPAGQRIGSISGGCLEEDLLLHLGRVMASGQSRTLLYDTTEENDLVWGVGLGCHGKVTLLLERLDHVSPALAFAHDAAGVVRTGVVLATAYDAADPAGLGTFLGVAGDGRSWHPNLAEPVLDALRTPARAALDAGRSAWRRVPELPGQPSVFFEYIPPPPRLVILGAGDDARPLARFARELGWSVAVADPRAAFATPERFPAAATVQVVPPEQLAQRVPFDRHTYAVVMTHHYVHDLPYLKALLPLQLPYVGLLGPRKRAEKLLADLRNEGLALPPAWLTPLHAPVGLDLGGDTPEAVALSMLAEMQAHLQGRDGRPLRDRTRPIHG